MFAAAFNFGLKSFCDATGHVWLIFSDWVERLKVWIPQVLKPPKSLDHLILMSVDTNRLYIDYLVCDVHAG